jgi:hypothetical protein
VSWPCNRSLCLTSTMPYWFSRVVFGENQSQSKNTTLSCLSPKNLYSSIVGHLFSNVVYQEQGNTIVNYYGPSSSEVQSTHEHNASVDEGQEGHAFII